LLADYDDDPEGPYDEDRIALLNIGVQIAEFWRICFPCLLTLVSVDHCHQMAILILFLFQNFQCFVA